MIPYLYESTETGFSGNGLGPLADALSCLVTREAPLGYELELQYPVTGHLFASLTDRRIVLAQPDQADGPQPFRIYRITDPIRGAVTVYARHISYDLYGVVAKPFTATSAADFAAKLKASEIPATPFRYGTDIDDSFEVKNETLCPLRSLLAEGDKSWRESFGGDLVCSGWNVSLRENGGTDRGVVIRYGVDLVDAQMERNIADVYTGIVPFWAEGDAAPVIGDPQYAQTPPAYVKLQPVDVTQYIASTPTKAQVEAVGRQWLEDNNILKPVVSLTLSWAQIGDRIVQLYDPIRVEIEKIGQELTAKVSKTVWDVLKERYESVEVGDVRPRLGGAIYDASRLRKGLLPAERIADRSIGGGKISRGAVSSTELGDNSVTVNKIVNGAVETVKIKDGAVTGIKVLDEAITLAKMWSDFQTFYSELIVALGIFSDYVKVDRALECGVLYVRGEQIVWGAKGASDIYKPITITDRNTTYTENIGVYISGWGTH